MDNDSQLKLFIENLDPDAEMSPEKLNELCTDTDAETVLKILAQFHLTLVDSIHKMKLAVEQLDENNIRDNAIDETALEIIWKTAHKISGSAELLGFVKYGQESRQLSYDLKAKTNFIENKQRIMYYINKTKLLEIKIIKSMPTLRDFIV